MEAALRSQAVHGGRLGTNLIEAWAIGLDTMAQGLALQHDLPPALESHFDRADPAVQQRLPAELAAAWRTVPLGLLAGEPPQVAVAVMDPLPGDVLAELAEVMGAPVVVAVACELRIRYYLERVYGIRRPNRFKRTQRMSSPEPGAAGPGDPAAAQPEETHAPPPPAPPLAVGPVLVPPEAGPGAESSRAPEVEPHERRGYVRTLSDEDVVEPAEQDVSLGRIEVRRIQVPITGEAEQLPADLGNLDAALRAIRRARDRTRVGNLVVAALEQCWDGALTAGMILTRRNNLLLGWKGFARGQETDVVEAVAVPLEVPSVFVEPCRSGLSFFGGPPGGGSEIDRRLWRLLSAGPAGEIGVHPVAVFGRLSCVLYVQSREVMPAAAATGVAELGQAMCAALERQVRADER